jgi:hypothetical protein
MKIILYISSTQQYTLANGPERGVGLHVGPSHMSHNSDLLAQVTPRLNATYAKPKPKGNLTTRMSFQVSVELADEQAAVIYAARYPIVTPRAGEIRLLSWRENVVSVQRILNCVITSINPQQDGVSVDISYSMIGGEVLMQ